MTKSLLLDPPSEQGEGPLCPLGEANCSALREIAELRQTLDELSTLVRTDPLTGIANYRYFVLALEQEMERTLRSGQPTTLIMLDIDHFKQVNDQWGHEVGNQALIHITKLIQQSLRKLDSACRYGGEEFAIILPNTDLRASLPVAERLRQSIAATSLNVDGRQLQLTASLGIDCFAKAEEMPVEELVRGADQYLYQAKQEGRNCVRHAPLPDLDQVSAEERSELFNLFGRTQRKPKSRAGQKAAKGE